MSFTFENQGTNTYLVYEIGADDELDTMSLGMLTNNVIPGFAAASFTQMDTSKYIKYNVSAKVSISQLFSGVVNKKRLIGVFTGIVDAMLSAEDYMLDTNNLLLDLDYIFADVTTCETVVVCLPVMNSEHKNPELGMFFKNIIFNTQFDQTENCDHVAQILNYLNSVAMLSLVDFKALLEKLGKNNPVQTVRPKTTTEYTRNAGPAVTASQQDATVVKRPAAQPQVPKQEKPQAKVDANHPSAVQPSPGKIDIASIPQAPQIADNKPMSMFYLLQHYNKENAAIYKAQKEAKKGKKTNADVPAARKPEQKAAHEKTKVGFAVPGKQEPVNPKPAASGHQASPVIKPPAQQVKTEAKPVVQQPAPVYQQPAQPVPARPINFGETTVLGGEIGETTVLGAVAAPNKMEPYLVRAKNNEKIPLNKPVFRIGKERSYVDYFIGDNSAISRSHANIVNHDGEYFVVDTNSTNHTYVNGGMIPSNVETKLSHGTKICLANEDFEFRLY